MKRLSLTTAAVVLSIPTAAFPEDNYLVKQAKEFKIQQCMPRITALSDFVIEQRKAGGNTIYDNKDANKGPLYSVGETVYSDASTMNLFTFLPKADGSCQGSYATVYYFDGPCIAQVKTLSGFEYQGQLQSAVSFLKGKSASAYLMDAGKGCIMLKQEIVTGTESR